MKMSTTDKKRKRQENGVDRPSKKVAVSHDKIKVVHVEGDAIHPVFLNAPGISAPKISFTPYSKPKAAKHSNAPVKPSTHELLLHSSQHPRLDYTASESASDDHLNHYMAVFDPATSTLKVAQAHRLTLRATLRSETQELEAERGNFAAQRDDLVREFGTKKARKAVASKTENAITSDPKGKGKMTDVQEAILESIGETTAGNASKQSEQERSDALLAAKPIPKPNVAAETVDQVYTFDALIPPGEARLVRVKDWLDAKDDKEKPGFKHQHPYARFSFIAQSDDSPRLKALKYLTLLLEFHDCLGSASKGTRKVPKKELLQKKLPASRWPQELVDSVRRRFTNDTGSELGKWQVDNLYTHICALVSRRTQDSCT